MRALVPRLLFAQGHIVSVATSKYLGLSIYPKGVKPDCNHERYTAAHRRLSMVLSHRIICDGSEPNLVRTVYTSPFQSIFDLAGFLIPEGTETKKDHDNFDMRIFQAVLLRGLQYHHLPTLRVSSEFPYQQLRGAFKLTPSHNEWEALQAMMILRISHHKHIERGKR